MLTSLTIAFLLVPPQDDVLPYDLNWTDTEANLRVPDPTQPNAIPELGYIGLWRTIYGDRDPRDVLNKERDGFVSRYRGRFSGDSSSNDGPDISALFDMRRPRLAAARRAAIVQRYTDMPSFTVSQKDLEPEVAAFVWDHQLQQDDIIADSTRYTSAPISTPRDYVPNTIVQDEVEDWTQAVEKKNLTLTISVAVIAVVLFVVIIFMPK